jgi:hypothetical protein
MELQAPDQTTIPALFSAGNKPIDRLWVYTTRGTKVDSKGGLKQFWRCNYCDAEYFILNITRVKIHLSGEGAGIVACPKVMRNKHA